MLQDGAQIWPKTASAGRSNWFRSLAARSGDGENRDRDCATRNAHQVEAIRQGRALSRKIEARAAGEAAEHEASVLCRRCPTHRRPRSSGERAAQADRTSQVGRITQTAQGASIAQAGCIGSQGQGQRWEQ